MSFRQWVVLAAVAWALVAFAGERGEKPDMLFIAVDDLNDWIGCLGGHLQARTPHLDALAARGVLFENAQCAAPACNPSRSALMSGLRPYTTGIYHNHHSYAVPLRDVLTLNRYLREQGYLVLGAGKIYHSHSPPKGQEDHWDDYYAAPGDPAPPRASMTGLNRAQFDWGPLDVADEEMQDYRLASWAAEQLQRRHDRPLFLAVGFIKPHLPWYVPRKYFEMFPAEAIRLPETIPNDLDDVPPAGVKFARPEGDHAAVTKAGLWASGVRAYLATITFLDAQVGRLIEAADRSWRSNRLVIVLWSDHGWHLGEKQHWRKFTLWEESARAPLIVVAPGIAKPGRRCAAPVDFLSIYPTVCDLLGLPIPPHVQGRSLLPLLRDPSASWDGVGITTHGRGNHGVRDRHWRYIRYADGSEELYDHRSDPHEWTNLAARAESVAILASLRARLPGVEAEEAPVAESEGNVRPRAGGRRSAPEGRRAQPREVEAL
ncbi:MAG: sulfatase [Kiritimatiellae bacterium]|nr:sulfatase [Kiritimatiellia bacterium]